MRKLLSKKLVDMVPDELRDIFEPLIDEHHYSEEEQSIVKQADALCAYLKCLEELSAGNNEFLLAKGRLERPWHRGAARRWITFMQVFVPSFSCRWTKLARIRRCKVLAGRRLCSTRPEYLKNGNSTGISRTQTTITSMVKGTPILTKSLNEYLPGPSTRVLTGEETGVINAAEAAIATTMAKRIG